MQQTCKASLALIIIQSNGSYSMKHAFRLSSNTWCKTAQDAMLLVWPAAKVGDKGH